MVTVFAEDEGSGNYLDKLLKKFKRLVDKSGLPKEIRKREFHVKRSKLRQKDIAAAKKRLQKKLAREKAMWEALQSGGRKSSSGRGGRGRGGRSGGNDRSR